MTTKDEIDAEADAWLWTPESRKRLLNAVGGTMEADTPRLEIVTSQAMYSLPDILRAAGVGRNAEEQAFLSALADAIEEHTVARVTVVTP